MKTKEKITKFMFTSCSQQQNAVPVLYTNPLIFYCQENILLKTSEIRWMFDMLCSNQGNWKAAANL